MDRLSSWNTIIHENSPVQKLLILSEFHRPKALTTLDKMHFL